MKLATWNINSLKVRLPQVLDWLAANPVDALCLQELKLTDENFPLDAFTQIGYHAAWAGQKTYNGVAILSREPGSAMVRNIPGMDDPQQRRPEERRVGKACVRTCRSRWSPLHEKKNKTRQ